ncbi:hypothetical protein EIN_505150 [Entamoeba invadens IP1]|uniref:Uncharacterized protein n=1 Tax=Entamoeba invadens IP1 TaxID=370355 RepID=A0A0A1U7J2_ENTIV|nr:hypothetical protein EIN_505150 [Entamoeba invadens IP1]ELP90309.1 hypothetical protein EIN_505150 [Entamoeba invadens IP1]|eukprot:XP_004257080.1 hypothetical protein EIN_505150 [Entamoeba invadens IP1]
MSLPEQSLPLPDSNAILKISSQTIFRHVPFTVEFSASPLWLSKNSIRPEDILYAGLRTKVLKVRTTDEVKECPSCSKGRKVIEIGVSSNQKFLEGKMINGRQIFTFDRCRSNCSSSRNHHKDQLYLSIEFSQNVSVSSQPFIIRSRVLLPKGKDEKQLIKKVDQKVIVVCVEGDRSPFIEQIKDLANKEAPDACNVVIKNFEGLSVLYIHVNIDVAEALETKLTQIVEPASTSEHSAFVISSLTN